MWDPDYCDQMWHWRDAVRLSYSWHIKFALENPGIGQKMDDGRLLFQTCAHTLMHTHTHTCIHILTRTHTHTHIRAHTHTHAHTLMDGYTLQTCSNVL